MARCALVNPQDAVVVVSASADPSAQTKAGWRWLLCAEGAQPAINVLTETMEGPTYTVRANEVTEAWSKRNLTAQEIGERKDTAIARLNGGLYSPLKEILLVVVNDVRANRAKLNALIDATGQSATVPKYPAGQTTQITMTQLVSAIKALI